MENWIVACAAATLLIRVGLALYACGALRAKNSGGILLRHLADLFVATLGFWALGMAIALAPQGAMPRIDWSSICGLRGPYAALYAPFMFQLLVMVLFSTGIVVGALSERSRFFPSLAPALFLAAVGVPLAWWAVRFGWLAKLGFHDYAGASFIHVAAAACAAVGVIFIGPRNGKYNRDGSSNVIPGHSLPLACSGALLLVVAWFPYLLGFSGASTSLGLIALNALLAAAAGGFASLIVGNIRYGKPDIYLTFTGLMAGLVAITAGADVVSNVSAVLIGAVAGVLVPWLLLQIDLVWKIDDPTGAIAIHGVGGAWSLLAAGLFGGIGKVGDRFKLLGVQAVGLLAIALFIAALTAAVLFLVKRSASLRAREEDEFDGLDLAEHDVNSYPDFQQTMIKSYHMREA